MSCTTRPVTHTADVEVNKASEKGVIFPLVDEIGSIKRIVPNMIALANPNIIICEEEKCFLIFASIIKTTIQVYLISYYHCSIMLFKMALTVELLY